MQGQTHRVNNTMYLCHTSCDILNAGTVESYLATVARWIRSHPYDVVTILLGNGDFVDVGNFTAPIQKSGIAPYLYEPPKVPMTVDDWPVLSQMILRQKRVVMFMDYRANQTQVPYILDEFSQLWETPFSPRDPTFPCTVQRPPGINRDQARQRLYMANHNLNVELNILGMSLLVPDVVHIERTNAESGFGSLGMMAQDCTSKILSSFPSNHDEQPIFHSEDPPLTSPLIDRWDRPPNFLLVDYYNVGQGSVFEVAAKHNNVTYNRECCGKVPSLASQSIRKPGVIFTAILIAAAATALTLIT